MNLPSRYVMFAQLDRPVQYKPVRRAPLFTEQGIRGVELDPITWAAMVKGRPFTWSQRELRAITPRPMSWMRQYQ
jgi:hypothetical protein